MPSFADISIRFGADLKGFSSDMQNVQRRLNRIGSNFSRIGQNLTLGVSLPLAGLGTLALDAAADFEALESRLETALGSGSLAKKTFQELQAFTKDLAITTEEAADSYIRLKNLGLDPSIAALESYGNTAAAQGKSINQLIEAVADAATGEFERLKEFGIKASKEGENVTFTFQGLSTTIGNSAQEIQGYLQELGNTTFAGSLTKEAETTKGFFKIILDDLRNISAEFGEVLIEGIKPLRAGIRSVLEAIQSLSPETKKFLVIFGGIAAAVGPLLALAGTILPAIGTGFALLTGPIGLIAAGLTAIGVIIYRNWEPIKRTLIDIANYFIDLYNEALIFRVAVEGIRTAFQNIYDVGSFVFGTLGDIISTLAKNMKTAFINVGEAIKAVLTGDFNRLPEILKENFDETTARFKTLIETAKKDFEGLKGTIQGNIEQGVANALGGKKYKLLSDNVDTEEVEEKIQNGVADAVNKGLSGRKKVAKLEIDTQGLAAVGSLDIGGQIADSLQVDEIDEKTTSLLENMLEFREGAREILQNAAQDFISGFAEILGAIASGNAGFSDLGAFFLSTIGQVLVNLGKLAIQVAVTIDGIKKALQTLNPVVAAIAGAAAIALGTLVKNQAASFAGNFAGGGIIPGNSFSGDRLVAGVNSGELILNIAQQKNLAAAIRANQATIVLQPSIQMDSRNLRVVLNQVDQRNNRST